jgi:hypothetical protein
MEANTEANCHNDRQLYHPEAFRVVNTELLNTQLSLYVLAEAGAQQP